MRKLAMFAIAGTAAALAGTAIAASPKTHRMDVPLPNGGVVHVDYVGDVAPKVTVAPVQPGGLWAPMAFPAMPAFGNFDRMFDQMQQQMRQIEQVSRQAPGMNIASYGGMPEGSSSVSVVTTSNGGTSCTRTTEIVSQGAGKPPKVTSNVSGNCGATPQVAPAAPSQPINRT
ncbi:MAG TPA: hypothetical protein VJP82_07535 [Sphingomicrobium sp.]|nr:hypothetical protein [Sphingomicrobium sp.]